MVGSVVVESGHRTRVGTGKMVAKGWVVGLCRQFLYSAEDLRPTTPSVEPTLVTYYSPVFVPVASRKGVTFRL